MACDSGDNDDSRHFWAGRLKQYRRKLRDKFVDDQRPNLSAVDVTGILDKPKSKATITVDDLRALKNALIDEPNNINLFFSKHGRTRGIIRELTGQNVEKQIEAASVICNLALGGDRERRKLIKQAVPYLITTMDSLNTQLVAISAWAIGNIASYGSVTRLLADQGVMDKLIERLSHDSVEVQYAVIEALTHIFESNECIQPCYIEKILQRQQKLDLSIPSIILLMFISFQKGFERSMLTKEFLDSYLKKFFEVLKEKGISTGRILNTYIATLPNLSDRSMFVKLLDHFQEEGHAQGVYECVRQTSDPDWVWFVGCMHCNVPEHDFFVEYEMFDLEKTDAPFSDFNFFKWRENA